MKKTLLFLFILNIVTVLGMKAQTNLNDYDSHTVIGNDTTLAHSTVQIVNTGTDPLTVKVAMDNFSAHPNHVTYFCWGIICYPPTTFVSPTPVVIDPGDTNTSFIGYLHPSGYAALSVVNYTFFNVSDESDSVQVNFTYDFTIGVDEIAKKASVSQPYPNPTSNLTRISYDLKSSRNASLVFYNLLGSIVKEVKLNDRQGNIILSTAGFESGIYYYSIVADGDIISTKKLVVAHK